jgi:hypothetical protein
LGVGVQLENFDDLFRLHNRRTKVILNDLRNSTEDDRKAIEKLLCTRYDSTDFLSNIPSCGCGETTGAYAEGLVGFLCPKCGTHVTNQLEQELEPLVWMRAPKGVAALPNPNFWIMLLERFKLKGFCVIQYLCDRTYKASVKMPQELPQVDAVCRATMKDRGYNNFVNNFDAVMKGLLGLKVFKKGTKKKEEFDAFPFLIQEYRKELFAQHLPVPNRALFVLENTNLGEYGDMTMNGLINAVNMMTNIDSDLSGLKPAKKEILTVKMMNSLCVFYDDIYRDRLSPKEGWFRKHVFGSRSHFSFRGVIASLTDIHDYDEIHVSWGIGVSVLSLHLTNKVLRMGWNNYEIKHLLYEYAQKWHPVLDQLFKELIEESPYKGIPVIFQRNPSLERGSAQAMFITKVKGSAARPQDAEIPTVSMSILSVTGFNADFDGKVTTLPSLNFFNCLEHPESLVNHNAVRKHDRDGLKMTRIGKPAAKPLLNEEGSTTIETTRKGQGSRVGYQADPKREALERVKI